MDYDKNYISGYLQYRDANVFTVQNARGELSISDGTIINCENYEFYHNISTVMGSGGSPVVLTENNLVIGIHTSGLRNKNINVGKFIGEIIKEIDVPNQINPLFQNNNKNKKFSINNDCKINNKNNYSINNKISNKDNIKINSNNNNKINSNNNNIINDKMNNKINDKMNNKINDKINNKINDKINSKNDNKINSKNDNNGNYYNQSQNSVSNKKINNIINKIDLELDLVKNDKNDSKDIITIYIQPNDQSLNCKIRCKNSDRFYKIVEQISEKEPKFIDEITYFVCNGENINVFKSLKDNKIKDDSVILLIVD